MNQAAAIAAVNDRLPRKSWLSRNLILVLMAAAFISAIYTYSTLTNHEAPLSLKPKRMWTMLGINLGLLFLLAASIAARVFNLWKALRSGTVSSQLQRRIVLLFSVVTILPTIIVSVFSTLFFNIGIQTWFNERVQTAVNESLVVAEAYLSEHKENIRADAIAMAHDLNAVITSSSPAELSHIVDTQTKVRELTESLVFQGNHILAQGRLSFALAFERIPPETMERAAQGEAVIMTAEDDKVRALVKLDAMNDTYLLVGRLVDSKVLAHMQSAQGAVNEYNSLKSQLDHLQVTFSAVFLILALLLLLSAIGYGIVFATRLTTPLSRLVIAAERVRGGDFDVRVEDTAAADEIGMMSRAFNRMTEQLQAQRSDLIDANRRLDERRRFSEAVLSGVSAGVIALDRDKKITLFNRSAASILSAVEQPISAEAAIGEVLPGINELLVQAEHIPSEVAHSTITISRNGKSLALHARVTIEKIGEEIEGFIVTFDDITLLVSAQRNAAWADVARRIAHEIKNPLTPIQLSAERLKRKYGKFITEDQDNYHKYIDTISKHVGDIGKIVEEFVSFARMPTPVFANEDLAGIIRKAAFSAQVANPSIEYKIDVPEREVNFYCDERQVTQVLTNLLKNAAESIETRLATKPEAGQGLIAIALSCENEALQVTIEDNGTGFPPGDSKSLLEPYVTTRTKGTGLGLAIVKKIVDDHKGKIIMENNPSGGARVMLSFLQQCDINAAS